MDANNGLPLPAWCRRGGSGVGGRVRMLEMVQGCGGGSLNPGRVAAVLPASCILRTTPGHFIRMDSFLHAHTHGESQSAESSGNQWEDHLLSESPCWETPCTSPSACVCIVHHSATSCRDTDGGGKVCICIQTVESLADTLANVIDSQEKK